MASNSPPAAPTSDGMQSDRSEGIKTPEQPLVHNGPEHDTTRSDGQPSPMANLNLSASSGIIRYQISQNHYEA